MTTDKQKSIRDFRGRYKKRRYASPSEAREIFDRMYARKEAEQEAYLRTPQGEAERQARNAATLARLKKNPRRERLNNFEAREILRLAAITPGTDFHALRSSQVAELVAAARKVGYRKARGYSGSTGRAFYHYLESKAVTRARKNPVVGKFIICADLGRSKLYYRHSTVSFISDHSKATHYKSVALAGRVAKSLLPRLPAKVRALKVDKV